ncbi:uncharacterized protein [Argopecten irradians]|uniref:uncharacterized protein n=1 Tax=Argopecten irradians TaxID=31199 RepID=UPI00371F10CE
MICGTCIVISAVCLISFTGGQSMESNVKPNMDMILNLQLRLSELERRHNEGLQRISELEKQQQNDQSSIATFTKQQQIDQRRISCLEKQRQNDQRRTSDLQKQLQNNQNRISDLETQLQNAQSRISDLQKQRGLSRISEHDQKSSINPAKHIFHKHSSRFTNPSNVSSKRTPLMEAKGYRRLGPSNKSNIQRQKRVSDNGGIVAFYAVLSHSYSPVTNSMEIHFDKVTTNIGGSYSTHTGVFTCTRAGIYVFSWTVHVVPRYSYIELVKNGVVVGNGFSGDSQYSGSGGNTVVLQLLQGDTVFVRVGEHMSGTIFGSQGTTTFSGFLLQ